MSWGRSEGYLRGGGYVVTWAIGHLVRLAEPHEIEAGWKRWRREALPILPGHWPLVVSPLGALLAAQFPAAAYHAGMP